MKVYVYLKTIEQKKIVNISAISEDRTKKFCEDIGNRPHRLLMLKVFDDFEKFCTQECGMKDKSDEIIVVNYMRMFSGDLFDFDTFLFGCAWCIVKAEDSTAKAYLTDLQGE